ncbi:helix-turn-helix domain-containing protein [Faucicola atlantae]|uniref:Transcriptional regulator n=1 Tax=Faucicola atlantae TaxID=34059 RepID=A0A1B8QDQ4_9GAMM|nr:helix-turn-helix transcriptional regulator [Moraxella atlantae]OBX79727.1 transcriptional regulator [Moraxella atlantae]
MIKINLPVLLAERGLKVAELDRQVDISRSTLYRLYNNDVIKIDIDAIDKLCKLLNCKPGDIILYEEDKP